MLATPPGAARSRSWGLLLRLPRRSTSPERAGETELRPPASGQPRPRPRPPAPLPPRPHRAPPALGASPRPARPRRGCGPCLVAAGVPPRLGLGLGERRTARKRPLTVRRRARGRLCMQTLRPPRARSQRLLPPAAGAGRGRGGGGASGGGASGAARGPPRGAIRSAAFRALLARGSGASTLGRIHPVR